MDYSGRMAEMSAFFSSGRAGKIDWGAGGGEEVGSREQRTWFFLFFYSDRLAETGASINYGTLVPLLP